MNTLSIYNIGSYSNPPPVYTRGMRKYPNNVRLYREQAGMSQEQLGERVGRTKDTISKWERGERKLKLEEARKIAIVLGVSMNQIADDIDSGTSIDEELMRKAAEAIQEAARVLRINLDMAHAMVYTVRLYNHVMKYRRRGEETEPTVSNAELILQQKAS